MTTMTTQLLVLSRVVSPVVDRGLEVADHFAVGVPVLSVADLKGKENLARPSAIKYLQDPLRV